MFATKPELAARMITRFPDSGHHAPWVAGGEVYGGNRTLRAALEERATGYALAVARTYEPVQTPSGDPSMIVIYSWSTGPLTCVRSA